MSHDHHFLERLDRASTAEAEFALSLYRDHEALRFILDSARLPPDTQRVALEITEGGPHIIVHRDGHFVTCLGAGMSVGPHPILPRGRIDALLATVADLRARQKMAPLLQRPGEGLGELFARLVDRSESLSREEFVAISGWQPVTASYFYQSAHDQVVLAIPWTLEPLHHTGPRHSREILHSRWKILGCIGHSWLLATMGSRDYMAEHLAHLGAQGLTFPAAVRALGSLKLSMRAWWGAARIGKPLVAVAKRRLAAAQDPWDLVDASMTLTAIGLRHASTRAEIRKAVTTPRTFADPRMTENAALVAGELARAFDDPDAHERAYLDVGRDLAVQRSARLPAGSPFRYESSADVPDDIARAMGLGEDGDLYGDGEACGWALNAVTTIARADAEDFYLPRAAENALRIPWTPDQTEELLGRAVRANGPQEPVRAPAKSGRNDPCPCGSGKKYKKCCAA